MLIAADQLNGLLLAVSWLGLGLLGWNVVARAPWQRLASDGRVHAFLGSSVLLMVAWTLKASVDTGLGFHLVGATVLTLMFGWRLALVALAAALIGSYLALGGDPAAFAANLLLKGAVPVLVSQLLLDLAVRRLPHHVFIYIFVNGFFAAALAVLSQVLSIALVFAMTAAYAPAYLVSDYLAFAPLMMFGEAWITGMLVAIFVSYRPEWLVTFEDHVYLKKPSP